MDHFKLHYTVTALRWRPVPVRLVGQICKVHLPLLQGRDQVFMLPPASARHVLNVSTSLRMIKTYQNVKETVKHHCFYNHLLGESYHLYIYIYLYICMYICTY
jgi:hypothetical protein